MKQKEEEGFFAPTDFSLLAAAQKQGLVLKKKKEGVEKCTKKPSCGRTERGGSFFLLWRKFIERGSNPNHGCGRIHVEELFALFVLPYESIF